MRHKKELNHSKKYGGTKRRTKACSCNCNIYRPGGSNEPADITEKEWQRREDKHQESVRTLQPKEEHVPRWWNPSPGSNAAEKWENLMPEKFLLDLVACKS